MGTAKKFKLSFQGVKKDNEQLAAEVEAAVAVKQQDGGDMPEEDIKALLTTIYTRICDLAIYKGQASCPDKTIMAAWSSFLAPIDRLTQIRPHGDFVSARMLLYLAAGFLHQRHLPEKLRMDGSAVRLLAMRVDFLAAIDAALLACLLRLWRRAREGAGREEGFPWVFAWYKVFNQDTSSYDYVHCKDPSHEHFDSSGAETADRTRTACLVRPEDATPENGLQGRRLWVRSEGDTTPRPRNPHARSWQYASGEKSLLMMEEVGSDGPVRDEYHYVLADPDDSSRAEYRCRPALRLTRRFVMDARKLAARTREATSRQLVLGVAARRLPAELFMAVQRYAQLPPPRYVHSLDLAAAYRAWLAGDATARCEVCAKPETEQLAKQTCLSRSIRVWNLPLRAVHTFHQNAGGPHYLCGVADCAGHHTKPTAVRTEGRLMELLESLVRSRCGKHATLARVGLGPVQPVVAPTPEDDEARRLQLLDGPHLDRDEAEEAKWLGIGGLVDVMLHGRTLLGKHAQGSMTTGPSWLLGGRRAEEAKVIAALVRLHRRCELC